MVSAFQVTVTVWLCAWGKSFPSRIFRLFSTVALIASCFPRLAHRVMVRLNPPQLSLKCLLYVK